VKLTRTFKDLLKANGSKETVSSNDDVEAHKLEIKETQRCSKKPRSSTMKQLPRRTGS
jgi:hypothetical protein